MATAPLLAPSVRCAHHGNRYEFKGRVRATWSGFLRAVVPTRSSEAAAPSLPALRGSELTLLAAAANGPLQQDSGADCLWFGFGLLACCLFCAGMVLLKQGAWARATAGRAVLLGGGAALIAVAVVCMCQYQAKLEADWCERVAAAEAAVARVTLDLDVERRGVTVALIAESEPAECSTAVHGWRSYSVPMLVVSHADGAELGRVVDGEEVVDGVVVTASDLAAPATAPGVVGTPDGAPRVTFHLHDDAVH